MVALYRKADGTGNPITYLIIPDLASHFFDDADAFMSHQRRILNRHLAHASITDNFQVCAAAKTASRHAYQTFIIICNVRSRNLYHFYCSIPLGTHRFHLFHIVPPFCFFVFLSFCFSKVIIWFLLQFVNIIS